MAKWIGHPLTPKAYTLADLINRLEREEDKSVTLALGFENPHSFRGEYSDLAFETANNVTIQQMLDDAKGALGKTFSCWKGGTAVMHRYSNLWIVLEEGMEGETIGELLMEFLLANRKED